MTWLLVKKTNLPLVFTKIQKRFDLRKWITNSRQLRGKNCETVNDRSFDVKTTKKDARYKNLSAMKQIRKF